MVIQPLCEPLAFASIFRTHCKPQLTNFATDPKPLRLHEQLARRRNEQYAPLITLTLRLKQCQDRLVIRLFSYVLHSLAIDDLVLRIEYNHRTRVESL